MITIKSVQKSLELIEAYQEFEMVSYYKDKKSYKIKLLCKNCGHEFERYTQHFIQSPHMCPKCHPKMIKQMITLEEAQKRVDEVYGTGYLILEEYKGNNEKVNIRCGHCNNIFQSVPVSLWRNRVRGCPVCEKTKSIGESRVEKFLREHQIQYRTQERFLECKDKRCLPFDFYLPQHNICIEFQGEQHFKERSFLWSEQLAEHDKMKRDFCKTNGIRLIEIPWYDVNKIDKYFDFLT